MIGIPFPMSGDQSPDPAPNLEWRDGHLPVSRQFDDPYFSLDDGLAETRHVFLAGNSLPQRFCNGFHIAELGFGTGLNLLATVQMWRATAQTGTLHFTTFEAFALSPDQIQKAHLAFPDLAELAHDLAPIWSTRGVVTLPGLRFEIIPGDARLTLPTWTGRADAWFLDGFSPAKNPELWSAELLADVAHHTAAGGTVATYTAAGHVRRGLAAAGFDVARKAGYGRKRHMTTARLDTA